MKTALTDEIQWKGAQHEKAIPLPAAQIGRSRWKRSSIKGDEATVRIEGAGQKFEFGIAAWELEE